MWKAIDLFAGIGGIRLGFEWAFGSDLEVIYSCEIDENACETYRANFGKNPKGDMETVDPHRIPDFDILLAGFPCQSFSIAGRKEGFGDTRGTLFFHIGEILRIKKPKAFLLENVKNLITHDKKRTFRTIRKILEDLGYCIYYRVLNAKHFGVPQNRERIFIVGFSEKVKFKFPSPSETIPSIAEILQTDVPDEFFLTQRRWIGLQKHRAHHEAMGNGFGYEIIDRSGIANTIVRGGMGLERNLIRDRIPEQCWNADNDDLRLKNDEGIRRMTPREWARLQGFPDDFQFPVAKTHQYRQLGNSVAVPVIKAIALEIRKTLIRWDPIVTLDRWLS